MKNLLFLLILTILTSCKTIVGDEIITRQNHGSYSNYQKIVIGKMISVNVSATNPGNDKSVTITTDKNLHKYIDVIEKDNTLLIDVRKDYILKTNKLHVELFTPKGLFLVNKNFSTINVNGMEYMGMNLKNEGSGKIIVDVHNSNVDVEQSGSGSIEVNGLVNRPINAKNSGSGNISIEGDQMEAVALDNNGSGNIILDGTSKDVVIYNRGSGKVRSLNSPTENASVNNSGSGNCYINVSNNLNVKISGSGNVIYKGNPKINEANTGSGKLIKL